MRRFMSGRPGAARRRVPGRSDRGTRGLAPSGVELEVRRLLATSARATADDIAFVTDLYETVLLREPTAADVEVWAGFLARGVGERAVARAVLHGRERTGLVSALGVDLAGRPRPFVGSLYTSLLDRAPDASGEAFWVRAVRRGADREAIVQAFLDSEGFAGVATSLSPSVGPTAATRGDAVTLAAFVVPTAGSLAATGSVEFFSGAALVATAPTSTYTDTVEMTATVTATGGGLVMGQVEFFDGATSLGTADVDQGEAVFDINVLTGGVHSLKAICLGDGTNLPSTSATASVTIFRAAPQVYLSASRTDVSDGEPVTFTVIVLSSTGNGIPSGIVTFYDGTTALGTRALPGVPGQEAVLTTSSLSHGTHTITAHYGGGHQFRGGRLRAVVGQCRRGRDDDDVDGLGGVHLLRPPGGADGDRHAGRRYEHAPRGRRVLRRDDLAGQRPDLPERVGRERHGDPVDPQDPGGGPGDHGGLPGRRRSRVEHLGARPGRRLPVALVDARGGVGRRDHAGQPGDARGLPPAFPLHRQQREHANGNRHVLRRADRAGHRHGQRHHPHADDFGADRPRPPFDHRRL